MLLVSSGAVLAADLPSAAPVLKAPAYVPAFSWTGLYLGGQVGYGWVDADSGLSQGFSPNYATSSGSPSGVFGGGFVGYNYQFESNLVVGIEADINGGSLSSTDSISIFGVESLFAHAEHELEWFGSVRARIGYAFDRFLPFVTAGYAFGSAKTTYADDIPFGDRVSVSETLSGWTIGGGLEYAFTDNIIARIEYRYADYGDISSNVVVPPFITVGMDQKYTSNDVRLGLSYKF
ncbi:porin family protein [Starkeya koreensis]|uniref:Porin family protein n=1 Tax=Ancylobacter koreensis TaxID=266121 RepID=A0ABT0DPI2_9HYPH|nr:outer membrane protein [Ancylobacter koreensis]MCK0209191.1 porin family protein [Ancylobacter koreensis]